MQLFNSAVTNSDPAVAHYFEGGDAAIPGDAGRAHSTEFNPPSASNVVSSPSGASANVSAPAVKDFAGWMRSRFPDLAAQLEINQPGILDAEYGSLMGISACRGVSAYLRGMGADAATLPASSDTTGTTVAPSTDWGVKISDFLANVLPAVATMQAQKSLIDLNIKRAEQGLPPLDSAAVSPQVNVGVSKGVETLGYVAIGVVALVGIAALFRRK